MIPAVGTRISWSDLPGPVRAAVEDRLGAPVVSAESQPGGFSPGTADRVVTRTGERAFVKAVSRAVNERSAEMARDELRITAALPAQAPVPRLLGGFDDGGWVVLIFEDIDGRHPRTPWVRPEIDAAVTALRDLAHALTPSPVPDAPAATDRLAHTFASWARIAADPPPDLDPWLAARLDELIAASDRAAASLGGTTLVHCDIRADNMLITPDDKVFIVDWPWGCIGPDWLDTALLAMNVLVHGGAMALTGEQRDVVIGFTGYLLDFARLPPPPGLPTVRAFQRAQADALLPWLKTQIRLDSR
ncbi:MAG TPA: aminoglycoside phosphotransferase family protein [Actinoplanes sp.]|nr:aminoglycoside phosphotransferase family protein [Actinoplanes sp.]